MSNSPPSNADYTAALVQIAQVQGQLQSIVTMLQNNHTATHQRIDDLATSIDNRFNGVEDRLGRVEQNERGTALRAAVAGAVSGLTSSALVSAALTLLKR